MKLLILSRAPYDGDRTKTCSNDRAVNIQRLEDASPYTCENTQQTNQMLTSHTDGLTERTSTIDSIINHSPAVYGAADNSHNMQSCDEVYKETRPRLLTGDAYDSLPLDLSGFKETSNSPQCRPPESCRNSESPLDLSVKTRKSIADSTYVNSVNNVTVPRPISMETQFYRNFEQSEKCQKVERRNETILKNTQVHKRTENNAPYIRNGFRCFLDSQPVKGDHRNLISHISHGLVQSSNSNKADLFSFDRSSQKQICYDQPSLHRHHSSEARRGFVNKSDNSRNRSGFQKYSFSDPHSLRVSPHAVLTPSSSLPCSPHSASTSPYLVPSSPRGYFSETTSPELSSASSHTELPNQISSLQETEKRIGEIDNGRSRVFQSNVPVTKPSVLHQVNAFTPPLRSQLPPLIEAQLPVNVDKPGTLNKDHNNLYFTQPPCHHKGKTSRSIEYFTPVSETERSRRNLSPPETRSPPTLSMVSPMIKPGNEAHECPMPVLSPHNTSAPGKTSAPPPLISFDTQRNPMYNNKIHNSSTQFESFKQYYITDNNTSAIRDGHKSVNSLHSEYGYDDIIGQKRKDIAGNSGARYSANVGNGKKFKLANHSRMNPFQQRSLAEYSETYRQQLLLRGVSAKHRSPPNSVPEPRPPATENRYNVNRLLHCERKTHSDATNASPESKTIPIPPRSGYQTNNHNNTSSLMKTTENILKYFSKENVHWNQSEVNTDRQMSVKQSSASTADMRVSAGDAVHQYRKQSVNAPVQSTKSTENFIGSHCSNDNDSGRGKFKDVNPKSHLGNLLLPFMIYGQVLLSGSQSNTDRQHSNTTNVEASIRNKVTSVNDWNNTTIDLTECDTVTSEPADNTDETNRSTGKAEIRSDTQPENNRDRTFNHDTKTDTEGKDTSVMLDSYKCLNGNLYLENISFGKNNTHAREKFEICNNTHLEYNCDHNSDHDTKTNTEYKDTSVNLDSCKYLNGNLESMAFGKSTDQISDIKENDQNRVEKKPDDSSTLSISANDESFDDDSEEFPPNDEVKNKTPLDSADDLASKDTPLSLQVVFNKKEQLDSELKSNKDSDMPMVTSCQSLQPKGNLLSGRLSVKCSPEYKKMCPLMKKVSLSLEKEMQRRTTGVHSRSQMSTCKILKNESEINRNDITIAGDVHVDAKVNMDNHDAFDFCESENEDSQSGRPRFQSIKRFAGSKRASLEISGRKESDENPKQRRCRSMNREESPVTELTKPVSKDNPKQKKRKKLDVYQQIKAVGKRKRKYQTRKTILRCKQNDHEDRAPSVERSHSDITNITRKVKRKKSRFVGVSSDSTLRTRSQSLCALVTRSRSQVKALDSRRPRKRYHKNEAYEEELAREEHRKAMLRAKRRQRQEHDNPDDVTLCAKRRQRQQERDKSDDVTLCAKRRQRQEHDNPDDVTLRAKRRQRQQEHDKSSLCPDDVITSKNSLENQEMENIQNRTYMIHHRPVGRPPKNNKKCNIKNEVKERRPVGRPRKSAFKPSIFQTKSKLAQKPKQEEKEGHQLRGYDINQDLSNTASGLNLDGEVDLLLGYENITQEGVSDDVLYLSSYIKDETKDDSDFADDATIIYDMDDTPEVHNSEVESLPLSGILSFPPDLKRLQVNKNVGETVLHRAARLGCEDVIMYCLETGLIDVNVKDHGGYTALHECCVRGNLDVAKRLIAYGANVNSSAQDGTRPIHDAVACNRMEMVRLLLSSGADPTLATYSGRTCAKIAHTKEMKEFLRGYESDLNDGEAMEVSWELHTSSIFDTANDEGFGIFGDAPPDDDVMDVEPHFDSSSQPHFPAYTLKLEADDGPTNYQLLRDVLGNMQMNRNEFFNLCGNVSNVTVTCDVFNRHVDHSQLLVSPWRRTLSSSNDAIPSIKYVELVRLNDNLRKHLCITKDDLSVGITEMNALEHLNDSNLSSTSYSYSTSGDLYPMMHNQSRDSYLFSISNFPDAPEMESELIYERKDFDVASKSVSNETPYISPVQGEYETRDSSRMSVDFSNPEIDESQMSSVEITTTTQTFSHTGGSNTASISPMKGSTLKLANTTRGCFRDWNVSGSHNPTSDRHMSSPATGEDACTLKVAQECMVRDSIIGSEFQAQQPQHSNQHDYQQHV